MKVLLVKMSSLGDVVHALPAVTDAARNGVRFHWVVEEAFQAVPAAHPAVGKVLPMAWRRWRRGLWRSRGEMKSFFENLTSERYDLAIDSQGLIKSALAMKGATAGEHVGFCRNSARESLAARFYDRCIEVPKRYHAVERQRRLFAGALDYACDAASDIDFGLARRTDEPVPGGDERDGLPERNGNRPERGRDGIEAFWERKDGTLVPVRDTATGRCLFLHGATWATKLWPEAMWVELAGMASGAGLEVVLPWGNDGERARAQRIAEGSGCAPVAETGPRRTHGRNAGRPGGGGCRFRPRPPRWRPGRTDRGPVRQHFERVDRLQGHQRPQPAGGVPVFPLPVQNLPLSGPPRSTGGRRPSRRPVMVNSTRNGCGRRQWRRWMHIAFCIFKYFPYGGIQRDLYKICRECRARDMQVRIYAIRWLAERPDDMEVCVVPAKAFSRHGLYERFAQLVCEDLVRRPVDLVVGMNKMPGLDVYYAGDSCYQDKARTQRSFLYRLLPRYRSFVRAERAVFAADGGTEILTISNAQAPMFQRYYGTPPERFPPAASGHRARPGRAARPAGRAGTQARRTGPCGIRQAAAVRRLRLHQEGVEPRAPGIARIAGGSSRLHLAVRAR